VAFAAGIAELRAFAHPGNIGSQKVLERSGFRRLRYVPEMDRFLYACPRPD
jgi:RimJ/RimL family protein N-acetyltransferase